MKRTIALLAVLVLLVSAVASPASAAGLSPLWGAASSSAGEDSAPAAQPELLPLCKISGPAHILLPSRWKMELDFSRICAILFLRYIP